MTVYNRLNGVHTRIRAREELSASSLSPRCPYIPGLGLTTPSRILRQPTETFTSIKCIKSADQGTRNGRLSGEAGAATDLAAWSCRKMATWIDSRPTEAQVEALRHYLVGARPDPSADQVAHVLSRPSYEPGLDLDRVTSEVGTVPDPEDDDPEEGESWKEGLEDHLRIELVDAEPSTRFANVSARAARLYAAGHENVQGALALVGCHTPKVLDKPDPDPVLETCHKGWKILGGEDDERYSMDRWERWMQRWEELAKQQQQQQGHPTADEALAALEGMRAAVRGEK
ncbi:hypothetical protein GGTG_01155 [Gaeumannomyces tritici R3-111a-1]|uniref:Uncharacterized protein n=1 Tax=Gaeumannomyces tritici (strain R3-111a-1) TaxID=644352 RepID=J3NIS1_GAET3|nr:hypothetical protein GGTG_01155 [Gaeumannomyces tritici R3-111a-1]EJT81171.1 hypothetical protein GGTG_01155 [Gaeumannomyces tritici R3-111a-1]